MNQPVFNARNYMGKRGRVGRQIYSAARTEAKETRTCPSLPHPNKRLPIRIGGQGWGDEIQHTCVRSQTHQLPRQDCCWGDASLGTESDDAASRPCPADFRGPRVPSDAIAVSSSWKREVQGEEEAPAPLGSVPSVSSDLLDALGKANYGFAALDFSVVQSRAVRKRN